MARKLMSFVVLLVCFSALPMVVQAQARPNAAQVYEIGKACYERVNKDAAARKDAGRWDECIAVFANLAQSQSGTAEGGRASYSAARLMREKFGHVGGKDNLENALIYYNRVVIDYPESNLADDALLQIAAIRKNQFGQPDRARKALNAVIERYPNGDSAAAARAMLAEMNGASPRREEKTADRTGVPADRQPPTSGRPSADASASATAEGAAQSAPASSKAPGMLVGVRHVPRKEGMTVMLEFDRPADYRAVHELSYRDGASRSELEILLREVHPLKDLVRKTAVESSTVTSVAVGRRPLGGTRVVIGLKTGTDYEMIHHATALEIVFRPSADAAALRAPLGARGSEADVRPAPREVGRGRDTEKGFFRSLAFWRKDKPAGPRPLRIVIDPGHGGDEKGAVGPHGIMEKDIVLSIAHKLADQLRHTLGAEIWLTREDDKDVPLKKRQRLAQRKKADLFISLHANASSDPRHAGIETYYLDNATDEAAKRLAERENESWTGPRSDIDRILATMLQNAVTEESRDFASDVQSQLVKNVRGRYKDVRDRSVRSALFYVLVGSACPSILVETSFITNPREEMRLADPTYQELVASSIAWGVRTYTGRSPVASSSL